MGKRISFARLSGSPYPTAIVLGCWLFLLTQFTSYHHAESRIDYEIDELCKKYLDADMRSIRVIALTNSGAEYYPANVIRGKCHKLDPKRGVATWPLDSITNQDLLIIHNDKLKNMDLNKLKSYEQIAYFEEGMSVYRLKK